METIRACVCEKLLQKADRLFTGTMDGRIIELLQNARRAGATKVNISNEEDGYITITDNGKGIEDFQKLLDLGNSGWDEKLEAGEDPAGVGLFCLAPRKVTILSGNNQVVIEKDGWTGEPVEVVKVKTRVNGTTLKFKDDKPWGLEDVEKHAVFCGMEVEVDGKSCQSLPFCTGKSVLYKQPGCKIEVTDNISEYHKKWTCGLYGDRVLVNFHGQVVQIDWWPVEKRRGMNIMIDIADKTDIRLMLPARTRLVENSAFETLKAVIELEYYKYYQRQEKHTLHYKEYLRAKQLGIELPEAEPQFTPGLIWGEYNEPVEVAMPDGHELADCYLCNNDDFDDEQVETNAHLLSALGEFKDKPFVPVRIDKGYMGYSWSKLPKVMKVQVKKGNEKLRHTICCADIACFDKLSITVHTSDGKVFNSDVPMAVIAESPTKGKWRWNSDVVCITRAARDQLGSEEIWFHLGGYNDDSDTYDTQLYYFEKELDDFWNELIGPYETLRQQLMKELYPLYDKWQKLIITKDGRLEILFKDGKVEIVNPSKAD